MVYKRFAVMFIIAIIFASVEVFASGCSGDCFSCHTKLVDNLEHRVLASCKECHNGKIEVRSSIKVDIFKRQDGLGCGNNCLDCHREFPKDSEHLVMSRCNNCHRVDLLR